MFATIPRMRKTTLLLLSLLAVAPALRAAEVLPFIENDWSKAIARAKSTQRPLFVDTWAPW